MRRATGRGCSTGRGAPFGVLPSLARAAAAKTQSDEARINVRRARPACAARGNHLENIRGTPRNPFKPRGRRKPTKLTNVWASGQPVGNCKTEFSAASTVNNFATEMTHE